MQRIVQDKVERKSDDEDCDWIRKTSQKILAIGAGLVAFLKFTDRIAFSSTPTHKPDLEFVAELVKIIEQTTPPKE